jgi:AcrR family transcriptional regulator
MWIEQERPRPRKISRSQPKRGVKSVRRSSKGDATRQRILDAAVAVVADEGYHAATHQRIAKAAGLVRTAINYHFPDQDSLADALVGHLQRLKAERVKTLMDVSHGDHPVLAVEAYWALLQERPFIAIVELEGCARTNSRMRARLAAAAGHPQGKGSQTCFIRHASPGGFGPGLHGLSLRLLEGMAWVGAPHDEVQHLLDLLHLAAQVQQELWAPANSP